jgi:SAM-dependent methyltransferase
MAAECLLSARKWRDIMDNQDYRYADNRRVLFDEQSRFKKARKIYSIIQENYQGKTSDATVLDIGCSTALIDLWLADKVKTIYGIDIDEAAVDSAKEVEKKKNNFKFVKAGGDNIPFEDNFFDITISNIMYNLLSPEDQQKMFSEIHRCLKPDGLCYFAAPNKLFLVHGKYKLPLLDFLPIKLARAYAKILSPVKDPYNEYPKTIFGLIRMVQKYFYYDDVTLKVIDNPDKYHLFSVKNKVIRAMMSVAARLFYIFLPNYIFILRKK